MDKLQPLITHRFWILIALAIFLPLGGWWTATGGLKQTIQERTQTLDSAFGSVPGGSSPNSQWAEEVKKFNEQVEKRNRESSKFLRGSQQELMFWPDDIADIMIKLPYRAEVPNLARDLYRTIYFNEVDRIYRVVEPFDPLTGEGKIVFDIAQMPHVDPGKWANQPPTSKEMWDAQEDLWLFAALFRSIARVNNGAENLADSPVRQLTKIELHGGDAATIHQAAGGASSTDSGGMEDMGDMGSGGSGFGSGASGPSVAVGQVQDVEFDVTKEFGMPVPEEGAAGSSDSTDSGGMEDMGGMDGYSFGGASASREGMKRYIHDDENMPFKTRGFYLTAVVDLQRVPELIAELTNTDFPVRVVRVHIADLFTDSVEMSGLNANGPGAGRSMPSGRSSSRFPFGGGSGSSEMDSGMYDSGSGMGSRPMMRPTNPMSPMDSLGADSAEANARNLLAMAMADRHLGTVAIAGIMTMYRPAEEEEAGAEQANEGEASEGGAAADGETEMEEGAAAPTTEAGAEEPAAEKPAADAPAMKEATPAAAGEAPAKPAEGAAATAEPVKPATEAADSPPAKKEPAETPKPPEPTKEAVKEES